MMGEDDGPFDATMISEDPDPAPWLKPSRPRVLLSETVLLNIAIGLACAAIASMATEVGIAIWGTITPEQAFRIGIAAITMLGVGVVAIAAAGYRSR